jgi:ribosome-binding factor A
MSRRTERLSSLIRECVGRAVLSKLSDPRIDPARTSVTRVEVPEDLLTARVYISVLGSEGDRRKTLRALRHAAGRIQELVVRQVRLRHTPVLSFEYDTRYQKTLETLGLIEQAMAEIREKEEAEGAGEGEEGAGGAAGDLECRSDEERR